MPTAIVVGATGILGRQIILELSKDPQTWSTIYALARAKKESWPSNVEQVNIDLLSSVDDLAKQIQGVGGDHLFFTAYLEKETEQENWDVNGDMIDRFLKAIEKTGVADTLKRAVLVTGCKQYGVHLGVPKNPMVESDPWLLDERYPPNFYYRQQNILHDFCKLHPSCSWVVTYPNDVIGFAKGNFMNLVTAIGLYAAVSKELGQDLVWPGSGVFYTLFDCFTGSKIHAQFCVWAALEPKAANQAFNVHNGDVESWQNLWPKVAKWFGMKVQVDQFLHPPAGGNVIPLLNPPPVEEYAQGLGLIGKIPQSVVEQRVVLAEWSKRPEVRDAWERLAEREGLEKDAFERATWAFLNFILGRNFPLVISMSKARKLGWTGYADTWDTFVDVLEQLEAEKVLPKQK